MTARILTGLLGLAVVWTAIGCAGSAPVEAEKDEIAETLDAPPRQVLVEAILFVVPVDLEPQVVREIANSAVAFGFTSDGTGAEAIPPALGLIAPAPEGPASDRFGLGPVQIALEALRGRNEVRVVTLPSVVVEAAHQAEIMVGTDRESSDDVELPEITLRVVPRLREEGAVALEVEIRAAFLDVTGRSDPSEAPPTTVVAYNLDVVIPRGSSILVRGVPLERAFRGDITTDVIITPTILE